MIHFSCDICGKELLVGDKDRFVLNVEIRSADTSWELTEDDVDEDNLEKVSKILQEGDPAADFDDCVPVRARYDLCPACREKFLKNPFGCQAAAKFDFSEN